MNQINDHFRKRGVKQETTYVNAQGRIKKEYRYKGMYITWDNMSLGGKWYYWRATYYASLEGALDGVDRHINQFKK